LSPLTLRFLYLSRMLFGKTGIRFSGTRVRRPFIRLYHCRRLGDN
jgi:hypothetical protein